MKLKSPPVFRRAFVRMCLSRGTFAVAGVQDALANAVHRRQGFGGYGC